MADKKIEIKLSKLSLERENLTPCLSSFKNNPQYLIIYSAILISWQMYAWTAITKPFNMLRIIFP